MGKLFQSLRDILYVKKKDSHELIGEGTTSTVKKVQHVNDQSYVYAMKVMSKSAPEEISYIKKEIKIHSSIDSSYIVKFWD